MTTQELEMFRNEFLEYYHDYIISADFDENENLIVFSKPYLNFDEVIFHLAESILDTVNFDDHIDVHLYQYGKNDYVEIGIN